MIVAALVAVAALLALVAMGPAAWLHNDDQSDSASLGVPAVRVGDVVRYATAGASITFEVLPPIVVETIDGTHERSVPVRQDVTLQGGAFKTAAFVSDYGRVQHVYGGCFNPNNIGCQDEYSLGFTSAGSPLALFLGLGTDPLMELSVTSLDVVELAKNATVRFAIHRVDECISLDPVGMRENFLHDPRALPYVSFRHRFELCPGNPYPTFIGAGTGWTLESYHAGSGPVAFTEIPLTADVPPKPGRTASRSLPLLPPRGGASIEFLDVHEAYQAARELDVGLQAYLDANPDAVLLDSRGSRPAQIGVMEGVLEQRAGSRWFRFSNPEGAAYFVEVEKEEGVGGNSYAILKSHATTAPFRGPFEQTSPQLSLMRGFEIATGYIDTEFRYLWINSSMSAGPVSDPPPYMDRYHYDYFFEGVYVEGGMFGAPYRVILDSMTGKPHHFDGPGSLIERYVPLLRDLAR